MAEKRILIVDDSEAARQSLRFSLRIKKYDAITASSGVDALKLIDAGEMIDLIITDMNMPEMNGLELIDKVRANAEYKFVPILVLSTDEEKGKIALGKGASGFVLKSGKANEEVVKLLKRYLS